MDPIVISEVSIKVVLFEEAVTVRAPTGLSWSETVTLTLPVASSLSAWLPTSEIVGASFC